MNPVKKMLGVLLLGACVALAPNAAYPQANSQPVKAITKAQEQLLLQQLNEKLNKIDELSEKYDVLQHRLDTLQQQLVARDAELEQARKDAVAAQADAAEAKQQLQATQAALGPNGDAVRTLQDDVAALKTTSSSLSTTVEVTEKKTEKLENPDAIQFKGIELKPGGFVAGETVDRQRGTGSDVNTPFNAIPFSGTTAGDLSEFNASGRQSRITLLAEGKLPSATLRGYYEADFLSSGTTSNDNQSNSYTLRQRQVWAQAALTGGWTVTAGQMWSLATEDRQGLGNNSEATPLTVDAQYNIGFTWSGNTVSAPLRDLGRKCGSAVRWKKRRR